MNTIHYSGGLTWTTSRGRHVHLLAGWTVCCSGERAHKIRASGASTRDAAMVTCRGCKARMQAAHIANQNGPRP